MELEKVKDDLSVAAMKFASIRNVEEFRKTNPNEFLAMFKNVLQNFHYIRLHTELGSDLFDEAIDLVDDIRYINPSLSEYVDIILEIKEKSQKSPETIDTSSLSNMINSYVNEIDGMVGWDPDEVGDIEFALNECRTILLEHQSEFSVELYTSLLNDIDRVLAKIDRFNKMMESGIVDKSLGF